MTEQNLDLKEAYIDLVTALLAEEEIYPWESMETDPYCQGIEAANLMGNYLDSVEFSQDTEEFEQQLTQLWQDTKQVRVGQFLLEQFGELVPTQWLEAIAHQAAAVVNQNLERVSNTSKVKVEELVKCLAPLLDFPEENLQVYARLATGAMRGNREAKTKSWEDLDSIEQAKMSMWVAKSAIEAYRRGEN